MAASGNCVSPFAFRPAQKLSSSFYFLLGQANTLGSYRSHFGSRYKSGRCDPRSPFVPGSIPKEVILGHIGSQEVARRSPGGRQEVARRSPGGRRNSPGGRQEVARGRRRSPGGRQEEGRLEVARRSPGGRQEVARRSPEVARRSPGGRQRSPGGRQEVAKVPSSSNCA